MAKKQQSPKPKPKKTAATKPKPKAKPVKSQKLHWTKRPLSKRHTVIALLLAGLVIVVMAAATFWELGGSTKVRRMYYGHKVRSAFDSNLNTMREALDPLGFKDVKGVDSTCQEEHIAYYATKQLFCIANYHTNVEVNESNRSSINAAAKKLDELIRQEGGTMSTNSEPTFEKWVGDVSGGVDYHPDITGTIKKDGYLCAVAMFVAYAQPDPPVFSVNLVCNAPVMSRIDGYLML